MSSLFESAAYMPHGYCLFWQPWLLTLHAGSDLLIFLSYSAIPLALVIFLNRRPDVRFGWIVSLFAAFIMLCGLTHAIAIATLWDPIYQVEGLVKLLTGIVSATTAISLFVLMPKLVAIPSPQQLEALSDRLRAEVEAHRKTLAQLRDTQREVEERIVRRTAELEAANTRLELVSHEAVHRGANLASVILSLARETARLAPDLDSFMERFIPRVGAISRATASLLSRGTGTSSPLGDVVETQLEPMRDVFGDRITIRGPAVEVDTKAAQQVALAVHELATNAVKYGSLSIPGGTVALEWWIAGDNALEIAWRERGGPPPEPSAGSGFGTKLLTIAIPQALRGTAAHDMRPDGLAYVLRVPLRPQAEGGRVGDAPPRVAAA